jgi:hypothetical protein
MSDFKAEMLAVKRVAISLVYHHRRPWNAEILDPILKEMEDTLLGVS